MNRRTFLGFACGGVVAAPAAVLVGERVIDRANGYVVGEIGPEVTNLPKPVTIDVITSVDGDARIRLLVEKEVNRAMIEMQRGSFALTRRDRLMRG